MTDALVVTGQEAAAELAESHSSKAKQILEFIRDVEIKTQEMYAFVDDKLGFIA